MARTVCGHTPSSRDLIANRWTGYFRNLRGSWNDLGRPFHADFMPRIVPASWPFHRFFTRFSYSFHRHYHGDDHSVFMDFAAIYCQLRNVQLTRRVRGQLEDGRSGRDADRDAQLAVSSLPNSRLRPCIDRFYMTYLSYIHHIPCVRNVRG